ncbi:MAG TPA: hypothetical protein VNF07_00730 [Acidimicrobiales bacterium]|nr:hypothetical protein [Acidimicrobiales bacterium]
MKAPSTVGQGTHLARVALSAAIVGVGVGVPAAAASASTTHRASPAITDLAKGQNYYKGKTLTFVAPDSPGGGFDQWARNLAPELAKYLKATVNVTNIPAGNTVAGQDAVAHSAANGLTVGWANAGPDVENTVLGLPALNFNPEREAFLGATAPGQTAVVVLNSPACSQFTSFDSLVNGSSTAAKIKETLQTTGTGTFLMLMLDSAFGIQYQPITGYQSTSAQTQGFTRGDGCLDELPAATADSLVTGGKARAILLSAPFQSGAAIASHFAGVPTAAQEYAKHKTVIAGSKARAAAWATFLDIQNSTRIFFAPVATKTPERDALTWAFQKSMKDPTLLALLRAQGNPTGQETGAQAKASYVQFLKDAHREIGVLHSVIG